MDKKAADSGQTFHYDATASPDAGLHLAGRLDVHAVERVWSPLRRQARELAQGTQSAVTLDVSNVEYCDGAGAALLHALG